MARRLDVEPHCRWLGWLEQEKRVQSTFWADLFVFTSLRLPALWCWKPLGLQTPVLCLDHQGMSDIVTPQCGIKIPVTTPRQAIAGLAMHWCACTITVRRWPSLAVGFCSGGLLFLGLAGPAEAAVYRECIETGERDARRRPTSISPEIGR